MTSTICGSDVHTPRAAATTLASVSETYVALFVSIEQSLANQQAMGITGRPIEMLVAMKEAATTIVAATRNAAAEAERHCSRVADTVGSDPSLAGTQDGRYMDPAAL